MNKIVVDIELFTMQQRVYIYNKGECTSLIIKNSIEDLKNTCYDLCKENNIHDLILCGPYFVTTKLKQELKETTKYNNFELNIDTIKK